MKATALTLGVDGCHAGWISIGIKNQLEWNIEFFSTINDLWGANTDAELILIDIPIGMRDKGGIPRLCDTAARKYLTKKRSSCIFPTPCRTALYAASYQEANEINKRLTGKGLSKQSWNITPKIREVDTFLVENPKLVKIFIETGPELCYAALAGDQPLDHYKKSKAGLAERKKLLIPYCKNSKTPIEIGLHQFKRSDVAIDDIMDAWVLAISSLKGRSNLRIIPEEFEYDSVGLPMRIAIPKF